GGKTMTRFASFIRRTVLFATMIALLVWPSFIAQAKGKGFKDVVKHIETNYRAKKTRIPMLGFANFAVKLIRPAGVKGFKLAVFEDQDFSLLPGAASFDTVMRESYDKDWQPLVQINSKRDGNSHTFIYVKSSGKDVQFALAVLENREAVVLEVKFNPDAAARFLENPKIMGISLGKCIRGNHTSAVAANRPPRRATSNSSGNPLGNPPRVDSTPTVTAQPADAPGPGAKPRPTLNAAANGENNPSPTTEAPGENSSAAIAPAVTEVKPNLPGFNTIRIETRLVNLNVKAVDKAGQPLTDLKLEDFMVSEDDVKQDVSHFKPVNAPVNVLMLLDLSGSTQKKRGAMIEAARKFIDTLPPQDKISMVAFTRKYRPLVDFTTDKIALKKELEQVKKIGGGTAFYDSMWQALDDLDKITDARKAIVVLTDGEDESLIGDKETTHTFDDLLGRASEEDVTVYPIYFSGQNPYDKIGLLFGGGGSLMGASDNRKIARKQLESLAEQTGGEVFSAQREEELEGAYKRVASELHTLYSLAYSPDKLKHNGEFRKVNVKIRREGAVAKTRRGYYDK
ncbi:MAG TPA: VWA domain-containing protein, partial [Blastocatellia bacterium]|nr:VWA domain-containing protein [Blastocatellia bacterium]